MKFWLGGPDPLDYISMYSNPGDGRKGIPAHWHYISFGLSDLFGDGRVHDPSSGAGGRSGFGFELTFRLKREADEVSPPTWPAGVMQSLAKYVFSSENILCPGDHVSWNSSLDNSDSRIQHMLLTEDPQLGNIGTPLGSVSFVQIIGVCSEELRAAQQWNGPGVIDLMKAVPAAGGQWLVTDMRRGESIFDLDPELKEAVEDGIAAEGSNLSGASAKISWSETAPVFCSETAPEAKGEGAKDGDPEPENVSSREPIKSQVVTIEDVEEKRSALSPTLSQRNVSRSSRMSTNDNQDRSSRMSTNNAIDAEVITGDEPIELTHTQYPPVVHITMNHEAGTILPLALRGRLKHGRHFTFKTVTGSLAITFLTESVTGSYVNTQQPFALHGPWLQVLIPNQSLDLVLQDLSQLNSLQSVS